MIGHAALFIILFLSPVLVIGGLVGMSSKEGRSWLRDAGRASWRRWSNPARWIQVNRHPRRERPWDSWGQGL